VRDAYSQHRWREAAEIAYRAIGAKADEDPLAWWCLTELIYAYGQRSMRAKHQS
jgi:hypothetical protein